MYKYVDLAVEMKQARKLKDALINYRNTCQQVNVTSLDEVIKYLVEVASERAEAARKEAQARLDDLGDLEAEASPEELVLSYVSGEKSADRTDREVVTPWFKFQDLPSLVALPPRFSLATDNISNRWADI